MSRDRVGWSVLGGWLGSGKTTLINRLLADPGRERIAVVVNDIGEINIDAALIANTGDGVIELTNGCVCCTVGGSLALTLRDLVFADSPPDRIVIETSGVADPAVVAAYGSRTHLRLDAVVTSIDVSRLGARLADQQLAGRVRRQIASASTIALTHTDVASPTDILRAEAVCSELAPGATIAERGGHQRLQDHDPQAQATIDRLAADPTVDPTIATELHRFDAPVTTAELAALVEQPGVVRAKGVITDAHGIRQLVQHVGDTTSLEPLPASAGHLPDALVVVTAA